MLRRNLRQCLMPIDPDAHDHSSSRPPVEGSWSRCVDWVPDSAGGPSDGLTSYLWPPATATETLHPLGKGHPDTGLSSVTRPIPGTLLLLIRRNCWRGRLCWLSSLFSPVEAMSSSELDSGPMVVDRLRGCTAARLIRRPLGVGPLALLAASDVPSGTQCSEHTDRTDDDDNHEHDSIDRNSAGEAPLPRRTTASCCGRPRPKHTACGAFLPNHMARGPCRYYPSLPSKLSRKVRARSH